MTDLRWWLNKPTGDISNASTVSTSSSGKDLLDFFGTVSTPSGQYVTPTTAMQLSAVYRCISIIGGSVAQVTVRHNEVDSTGLTKDLGQTPLWYWLNEQPDPLWTATSAWEFTYLAVATRGDMCWRILRGRRAEPVGFEIMHPDRTGWQRKNGRLVYAYSDPESGSITGLDQDDVLHFAGFGFNGVCSPSVISTAAKNSIGNELAASEHTGRAMREGGLPRVAITMANRMQAGQKEEFRESYDQTYGAGATKRYPLVLDNGGTVKELSLSPVDLQLLQTRQFNRQEICSSFGVPPILIGDNEKTTSWGTGIEQIYLGFVRNTLQVIATRWEEELNRKLFRRAGQSVKFDFSDLLRGDMKALAEFYSKALGGPGAQGWMHVDEVRRAFNLSPSGLDKILVAGGPAKPQTELALSE